jgi:hypothetical protein
MKSFYILAKLSNLLEINSKLIYKKVIELKEILELTFLE